MEMPGPGAGPPASRGLDPRVILFWRITGIGGVLFAVAASAALAALFLPAPPSAAVWAMIGLLGSGAAWVGAPLRYDAWSYDVQDSEVRVRRGVFARTTSLIPLGRIQHVDTRQDLVERWLGLARVVIYTAGIRGAELTIPGLAERDAVALRDRLAAFVGADRAV